MVNFRFLNQAAFRISFLGLFFATSSCGSKNSALDLNVNKEKLAHSSQQRVGG